MAKIPAHPGSRAAHRIDAVLADEAMLAELVTAVTELPAHSGANETLRPAQKLRKRIAQLTGTQHADVIRERAERLLQTFYNTALRQGYPAWWRDQKEALRMQRQGNPAETAVPAREPSAQRDQAAMADLPTLNAEVDAIIEFERSRTNALMKLRSRIGKYTGADYGLDVQAAASDLRARFDRVVTRLGYGPWWENEQAAMATGNRSPRLRGHATR